MIRGDYHPPAVLECASIAARVEVALADRFGGLATAVYVPQQACASGDTGLWTLERIDEFLPPVPPQLRTYDDSRRLPMLDAQGYSVTLEAEQRRKEWADWDARQAERGHG